MVGTGVGTFDAPGMATLVRLEGTHALLGQTGLVDPVAFGFRTRLGAPFIVDAGGRLFPSTQAVVQETLAGAGAFWWIWNNQCARWNLGDTVAVRVETLDRQDTRLGPPDTTLAALAVDGAALNEAFDPATADYTASTDADAETATITATPTDPNACSIDISPADADTDTDGHQIDLNAPTEDETTATTDVTVTVTTAGGAARSYQVAIERPAPLSDDAALATLAITDTDDAVVLLTPAFDTDTTAYTAQAAADIDQVTITATPADGGATAQIAPADADTAADGHQIDVAEGTPTALTVTVTAADDTTTQAYEVAVSRDPQTPAAAASAGLDTAPGWSLDPATKRYHLTPRRGATSGRLTMTPVSGSDLEAFTVDASLRTRQIGTDGIARLSATKDTILFIRASGGPPRNPLHRPAATPRHRQLAHHPQKQRRRLDHHHHHPQQPHPQRPGRLARHPRPRLQRRHHRLHRRSRPRHRAPHRHHNRGGHRHLHHHPPPTPTPTPPATKSPSPPPPAQTPPKPPSPSHSATAPTWPPTPSPPNAPPHPRRHSDSSAPDDSTSHRTIPAYPQAACGPTEQACGSATTTLLAGIACRLTGATRCSI